MQLVSRVILAAALVALPAAADREASNQAHVAIAQGGRCYAKSIPEESYGSKGTTKVYAVGHETDGLLHTLPAYAGELYLACNVGHPNQALGTSVVLFGPGPRGSEAKAEDLAVAFYFGGKLVRSYSTLDIAGDAKNVLQSVSHYRVFQTVLGYSGVGSNFAVFEVITTKGKRITFDPTTGEIIPAEASAK